MMIKLLYYGFLGVFRLPYADDAAAIVAIKRVAPVP